MNHNVTLGLDIGTTGCKVVAVSAAGQVLASTGGGYPLHTTAGGAAEQDPAEIEAAVIAALREAVERLEGCEIRAIGLSGAMHSLLAIDHNQQPMGRAVTWADTRSAPAGERLRERLGEQGCRQLHETTGCPVRWTYHPARLRWLSQHAPDTFKQASRLVSIKELITHRLTGRWAIGTGLASTTGLLDTRQSTWHEHALRAAGIGAGRLSDLVKPTDVVGHVTSDAARQTRLRAGLPVVAGGSDGALANLGSGAAADNGIAITVGTSGAVRAVVSEPFVDEHDGLWCYQLWPGRWLAGGAINNGGLALNWVCERFYMTGEDASDEAAKDVAFEQMWREAAAIEPGAAGVTFLPWFTGERNPHWQPHTRAGITGLTLNHGRAHIARSAMEAVAFCLADVFDALSSSVRSRGRAQITGGITRSDPWLQIVADVLNIDLLPADVADASALGAAVLAWASVTGADALDVAACLAGHAGIDAGEQPSSSVIRADAQRHAIYQQIRQRYRALSPLAGL